MYAIRSYYAFGACASAPPNLNDDMIIPGERVGNVELGMSLAELFALKGTPYKTIPIEGTGSTSYNYDGLTVGADDKVYWIIARDARSVITSYSIHYTKLYETSRGSPLIIWVSRLAMLWQTS